MKPAYARRVVVYALALLTIARWFSWGGFYGLFSLGVLVSAVFGLVVLLGVVWGLANGDDDQAERERDILACVVRHGDLIDHGTCPVCGPLVRR